MRQYLCYWNLLFIINVIIIRNKVLFPGGGGYVTVTDFGYPVWAVWFYRFQRFSKNHLTSQSFDLPDESCSGSASCALGFGVCVFLYMFPFNGSHNRYYDYGLNIWLWPEQMIMTRTYDYGQNIWLWPEHMIMNKVLDLMPGPCNHIQPYGCFFVTFL